MPALKPQHDIIEYCKTYVEPISKENLNTLDFAIFSQFSYINLDKFKPLFKEHKVIRIKDLFNVTYFKDLFSKTDTDRDKRLFFYIVANPRYHNMEIRYYKNKLKTSTETEEFSAVSLKSSDFKVVAYQGTTPNSYYGWREDFELSYHVPIPSHKSALKYLQHELNVQDNLDIYLTGHSKGGNIATYAYTNIEDPFLRSRIKAIYCFDSPAFEDTSYLYLKENGILKKYVPNSSIIGMIFESEEVVNVCKAVGNFFNQHSLYSWEVDLEKNDFVPSTFTDAAIKFNKSLADYCTSVPKSDREYLVNLFFDIIKTSQVDENNKMTFDVGKLYKEYKKLLKQKEPKERERDKKLINELVGAIIKGIV